ncbi:MAG: type II toxin-antitoxin system VapC family toxin [bacterium]
MPMSKVFLDTAYAIALSSPNDEQHKKAVQIAEQLEADATKLVTTRAVILEIGNALAKLRYRKAAVELLDSLEQDPNVEIIPISEELYKRAFQFYRERPDKEWGITDCISFVIMQEQRLTAALTTDEHFQQAGFQALLMDN